MKIIFSNEQERRKKVFSRWPYFKSGGFFYRRFLSDQVNPNRVVLDVGCGDGGILGEFRGKAKVIIGVDVNEESLWKNSSVDEKILASGENLPLDSASVDVATAEFVIEHIENPERVFAEIFRVLKPGGCFIFITPNLFNPVMLASYFLPFGIHKFLRKKILQKTEDAHFTYYRGNTCGKLTAIGKAAGFSRLNLIRAGNPEYLAFSPLLVLPSIAFEKLIAFRHLNFLQMYLVGCFHKPE
jgi:ubiquinone/menaquinone biosynthesis C-methylase UbiE